eukprot:4843613-Pyramimonas_sp.AAC.1
MFCKEKPNIIFHKGFFLAASGAPRAIEDVHCGPKGLRTSVSDVSHKESSLTVMGPGESPETEYYVRLVFFSGWVWRLRGEAPAHDFLKMDVESCLTVMGPEENPKTEDYVL